MRVCIVGTGAVGSLAARLLAKDAGVEEVRCGDRDPARARRFLGRAGGKVRALRLDASRSADVARAARGCDLVINAGLPDFNLPVMRGALAARAHYQDLCSQLADLRHAEQFRLHRDFARAGLLALMDTGAAPGVTNLLARELAEGMTRVDAVRFRLLEDQDADAAVFTWSPAVIADELSSPPLVRRRGKYGNVPAFSGAETFDFGPRYGKCRVVAVYGDEVATLGRWVPARDIEMKAGGADIAFGEAAASAGLLGTKPVLVGGRAVVPRDVFIAAAPPVPSPDETRALVKRGVLRNAAFVAVVEADGRVGRRRVGRRADAVFPDLRAVMRLAPGANTISYPTALAAAAFARLVPGLGLRGVFPPEALEAPARRAVLAAMRAGGTTIAIKEKTRR
jgi:saccharopine dehydrogenase-like NADP-dependent oxidoreductase